MAATSSSLSAEKDRDGASPSAWVIGVLLVIAIAVVLLLLYALWKFWPTAATLKSGELSPVNFLGIHRLVTPDVRMFIIVAIAGALGGLMHSTRSFAWYVGHRGLKWHWVPYYILTLVIGAGLATIVYAVMRGGLFTNSTTTAVNPYGFVAIGAIVGLFTEQALEMLHRVASDFFAQAPAGADTIPKESNGSGAGTAVVPDVEDAAAGTGAVADVEDAAAETGGGTDVETAVAEPGVV